MPFGITEAVREYSDQLQRNRGGQGVGTQLPQSATISCMSWHPLDIP